MEEKQMDFAKTVYGRRFFESQLPRLIKSLERIANALEEQNRKEVEEKTAETARMWLSEIFNESACIEANKEKENDDESSD